MKTLKNTSKSGFPTRWESEALTILNRYEKRFADRLPDRELRSRALQKLNRAKITDRTHLAVLISKIVHQVLINYGKEQSRHYRLHVYDYAFDWPSPDQGLAALLQDRLDDLLGPDSPLSGSDKALLQIALDDPVSFIRPDGHVNQSAMGEHLGVNQRTIGRRWQKMLEKIEAWRQGQMDLSI